MKIDHKAISDIAQTYENPVRQARVSLPIHNEIGVYCFEQNKNMSVTIGQALMEFLIRNDHDWSDPEMRAIVESAEVAS